MLSLWLSIQYISIVENTNRNPAMINSHKYISVEVIFRYVYLYHIIPKDKITTIVNGNSKSPLYLGLSKYLQRKLISFFIVNYYLFSVFSKTSIIHCPFFPGSLVAIWLVGSIPLLHRLLIVMAETFFFPCRNSLAYCEAV